MQEKLQKNIHVLRSGSYTARALAARDLGDMGLEASEAIPHLVEAMAGSNIFVAMKSGRAIIKIESKSWLEVLISQLSSASVMARRSSALVLREQKHKARGAIPALEKLAYSEEEEEARLEAIRALIAIRPEVFVPNFLELLGYSEGPRIELIIRALRDEEVFRFNKVGDALFNLIMRHPIKGVQQSAEDALCRLDPNGREMIDRAKRQGKQRPGS